MTTLNSTGPFTLNPPQTHPNTPTLKPDTWTRNDLLKYAIFVYYFHSKRLLGSLSGSKWSFFRSLSIFIQRKNPNQCRILHLAMLKKH